MSGSNPNCGPYASYALEVDWNNDGDYSDTKEAVTTAALKRVPISFGYGRDQLRALSPTGPGEMSFSLCNADLTYSPGATGITGSPIGALVLPGRKVRLLVTPTGGSVITGFAGRIDDLDVHTAQADRTVDFAVVDGLEQLKSRVTTPVFQACRTGTAINAVLDAAGWPAADRDIDPGATVMEFWWGDGIPKDLITELVAGEGPPSICYVDRGVVVFKDRHHRIFDAPSLTSQAYFCIAGKTINDCPAASPCATGTLPYTDPLGYNHGMKNIVNKAEFTVTSREPDPTLVWATELSAGIDSQTYPIIATLTQPVFIPIGDTAFVTIDAGTPFINAVFPGFYVGDIRLSDFSSPVGDSISATSGTRVTIGIRNFDVKDWTVVSVSLRAQLLLDIGSSTLTVSDAASIATYGEQPGGESSEFLNQYDAAAVGQLIVKSRKDRVPTLSVRIVNGTQTLQNNVSQRRISDLVTIRSDRLGIDDPYFIERVDQSIRSLGRVHEATFGCEQKVLTGQPSDTAYSDPVFNAASATGLPNLDPGGSVLHTPTGTPRAVLVWIVQNGSTTDHHADAAVSVRYGNVQLTFSETGSTNSNGRYYRYFRTDSIPSGNATVSAIFPGTFAAARMIVMTFNADNAINIVGSTTVSNTTANPTANVTTTQDALLVGLLHSGQDAVTGIAPGANYTDVDEGDFGTETTSVIRRTAGAIPAGTNAVNWTATADTWTVNVLGLQTSGPVFQFDGGVGHRFDEGVFAL